ncbi:hypothetical protein DFH09DRAFT_1429037 [Mycena vulgaris]|nr:hypothetical protein DFH09DRAFT_1429037 [Mycena vulgaris]
MVASYLWFQWIQVHEINLALFSVNYPSRCLLVAIGDSPLSSTPLDFPWVTSSGSTLLENYTGDYISQLLTLYVTLLYSSMHFLFPFIPFYAFEIEWFEYLIYHLTEGWRVLDYIQTIYLARIQVVHCPTNSRLSPSLREVTLHIQIHVPCVIVESIRVPHRESSEHGSSAIDASNAPPSSPSVHFPGSTHVPLLPQLVLENNGLKINAIHPGPSTDTISSLEMSICLTQGFPQAIHRTLPTRARSRSRPPPYAERGAPRPHRARYSGTEACALRWCPRGEEGNWVHTSPRPRKSRAAASKRVHTLTLGAVEEARRVRAHGPALQGRRRTLGERRVRDGARSSMCRTAPLALALSAGGGRRELTC